MVRSFAVLTLVSALGACANTGDEGFVVLNNTAVSGTSCALTGAAGQAFQPQGLISTLSPSPYVLTPLLQSRITATTDQEIQRTINLEGARIDLKVVAVNMTHADGTAATPAITLSPTNSHFQSLFAGSIPPSGSANVAFDLVPLGALSEIVKQSGATATDTLNVVVQANVVVFGLLGGAEVDSNPFQYPVTVCNNCVVNLLGGCPQPSGTMIRTGNPCNPFQDGSVDCCTVFMTNALRCPANVASM